MIWGIISKWMVAASYETGGHQRVTAGGDRAKVFRERRTIVRE